MPGVKFLLILMTYACLARVPSATMVATYEISEDKEKGHLITSVPKLFNLTSTPSQRFKMLSQKLAISSNGLVFDKRASKQHKYVELDGKSGRLTLLNEIDRDEVCGKVKICAIKLQMIQLPQQKLIEMNLIIDDVNDNSPIFPKKIIEISVAENMAIGETYNLDSFMATDKDSDLNGEIEYTMTKNSYFVLNLYQGRDRSNHLQLKLKNKIDYETMKEVELTISASDKGKNLKTTSATLRVIIIDINDNTPAFQQDLYTVNLRENSLPGQEVVTVEAYDADSGVHGQIKYYLSQRNDPRVARLVAIDSLSGAVTLKEKLDRERDDGIKIRIEARDTSFSGQKVGETFVLINIEDINDNAPIIHVNYVVASIEDTAYVKENSPIGTYIARVTVTDADEGNNGNVDIEMNSKTTTFDNGRISKRKFILNRDGFLETLGHLDREICDKYSVEIIACDQGQIRKCSSVEISIVVLDVNEYAPKFDAAVQRVVLLENVNIGTNVLNVHARDKDAENGASFSITENDEIIPSENGMVHYSITSGGGGMFDIGKTTGRISLVRQLDREYKNEWTLKIIARDGGQPVSLESSCDVIIKVDDVNDNRPFFVNPAVNNSLVYASTSNKDIITNLKAIDYDTNHNAKITYKIVSVANMDEDGNLVKPSNDISHVSEQNVSGIMAPIQNGDFILNPISGELRLNFSRTNNDSFLGLKRVLLSACDSGDNRLCSVVVLRVMITHMNIPPNDVSFRQAGPSDTMILSISLGSVVIFLILLIAAIIFKCKRNRKEMRSYSIPRDTNRSEYSLGRSTDDEASVMQATSQYDDRESVLIVNENTPVQVDYRSGNSTTGARSNSVVSCGITKKSDKLPAHSDGDSGRGDSEPDNTCTLGEINTKPHMGSMCSVQCLRLGHSDKCWMPRTNKATSVHSLVGSTQSIETVRNEKFYNWQKMKPKFYNSPLQNEQMMRCGRSDSDLLHRNPQPARPHSSNSFKLPPCNSESKLQYSHPSELANRRYSASAISRGNNLPLVGANYRPPTAPRSTQSTPCEFLNRVITTPQLNTVYEDKTSSPQDENNPRQLKYLNDQYRVSRSRASYSHQPNVIKYPYRTAC